MHDLNRDPSLPFAADGAPANPDPDPDPNPNQVGVATVAGFALWFTSFEGGPQLSYYQVRLRVKKP